MVSHTDSHMPCNASFAPADTWAFVLCLSRDSVTFDMMKALHSVQDRLSASLSTLSKPRQQTVTELVDSVRQQIAGADELGATTHSGADEVQLLEHLGTGSVGCHAHLQCRRWILNCGVACL